MSADGSIPPKSALSRQSMLQIARGWASAASATDGTRERSDPRTAMTDFATLPSYREMKKYRAVADELGLESPYFKVHEGRSGETCVIDGRTYSNFLSYDYLGINGDPRVNQAAVAAIEAYGTSVSASRPTAGDRPLHRELEAELARLYETEDALVFVSGHGTNVSVVGELLGRSDLLLYDALSHNSIVVGSKLCTATRRCFPHNDMASLERMLKESRHRFERVLIVVEGLYSMDGDLAPLPELIALKSKYQAWLMVDEAHSLGVVGSSGRGIFEHFDLPPDGVDIWMGTLSKTLSACGGYVAGCRSLIDNLKFNASAFMYSVGMAPPVAGAALAALRVMRAEPERVTRLQSNGQVFLEASRQAGLDVGMNQGFAIGVVIVGDSLKAARLSNRLFARGITTIPVTYPAVPMRQARLRLFLTSRHTHEQIRDCVHVIREELDDIGKENFGLATAADAARAAATYVRS